VSGGYLTVERTRTLALAFIRCVYMSIHHLFPRVYFIGRY
jgi:hypothetical protein